MKIISVLAVSLILMTSSLRAQSSLAFLHKDDVIVFQGDSITDGGRWRTGQDYNHIMGQDYAYIIAAKVGAEHPERNLTFINRGISGNRVLDLEARWRQDTLALKPNLLSILVGVNDTLGTGDRAESVTTYERVYDELLEETEADLPGVKIILGEPFLLPVANYKADYKEEFAEVKRRQKVVEHLAAKYHLPLVMYQDVFNAACKQAPADHWSWDGVHPTYAGHWLMVQAWLKTSQVFWSQR